jgi:hypothetical protein
MTKRDSVANLLYKSYHDAKPGSKYCQIVSFANELCPWTHEKIHEMRYDKAKKSFFITDVVPISSPDLPHYANNITYPKPNVKYTAERYADSLEDLDDGKTMKNDTPKKKTVAPVLFSDETGLFKITFNDDSIMFFAKWFSGGGKSTTLESMWAAERNTWYKWARMFTQQRKRKAKPKTGSYRISQDNGIVIYEPIKKIPNNPIFHSELDKIRESVSYYFNNVSSFMKYNQAGRRSLLLYGEQGTSKTSTLYTLALEHEKTKSIVFSTDIQALAIHIMACEKYSIPTLAFFEDAEGVFSQNNSSVKNFLSGIDAKQNKAGTCIIYTTNYPERIESTIIERPERVDELHYIGPIDGQMLVDCATFYFGKHLSANVNLANVLTRKMTGAEVKLMVENTLRFCAANQLDISENAIKMVLTKYVGDLKKLKDYTDHAKKTLADSAKAGNQVGFNTLAADPFENLIAIPKRGNGNH